MIRLPASVLALFLGACSVTLPENIKPVTGLDAERYLGTWYEIARYDHSFERGLEQVTARYGAREDGGISVTNRGFHTEDREWSEANGRAYFVQDRSTGFLKVSFFRPFYGAYVIFDLAEDYQTAYVTSGKDYLWFLARTPTVSAGQRQHFLETAQAQGFDTNALIWVRQRPD